MSPGITARKPEAVCGFCWIPCGVAEYTKEAGFDLQDILVPPRKNASRAADPSVSDGKLRPAVLVPTAEAQTGGPTSERQRKRRKGDTHGFRSQSWRSGERMFEVLVRCRKLPLNT